VRYTLDDVVELPEIVYQHETVPLSPNAAKIYKKLSKEMLAQLTGGEVSAVNEGVLRNKLLQVACGWAYGADGKCIEIDAHHPRLEKLIEVVEACARKVIVFCPFTEPMKNISKHLTKAGLKNEMIWGGTSQVQRGTIFQQFRADPKMKAIVAHPGTMAHGLTLTEADTIIWFSPTSSLETFEQANARIRRIGQKSKQLIVMLGGTDVERKTYRDLERKQKFQNSLLDLLQEETATHE
jgi:SNF2 family DNA or RNA helicase